jgi:NAD(P)-dependent dehydrogenase (short-subunit alcohol dehydrogenase family)
MDLKLNGKVALVTGAGSQIGFGRTIALVLAKEGCDVISHDINLDWAKQTADQVKALGRQSIAVKADVSKRAEVDEMVKTILKKFGRIDILVNNAGASSQLQPFMQMTQADWDKDIHINLYGQMNVCQAVIPGMISQHYGRIVNFAGGMGVPTISIYGAAKGGVVAFSQALSKEVAQFGIIVNGVIPGVGETGLTTKATQEFKIAYAQGSLLKRLCTPEDVASTVAFLASDVCSYMIGQFINMTA